MAETRFDEEKILPAIVLQRLKREDREIACDTSLVAAQMIKPYPAAASGAPLAPKIVLDVRRPRLNETERGQGHWLVVSGPADRVKIG